MNVQEFGKIKTAYSLASGKEVSVKEMDDRISFQKVMFLLKTANFPLETNFTWYVRGPYSSSLANTGFKIVTEKISGEEIDDNEKLICANVKRFLRDFQTSEQQELVASLVFLKKELKINYDSFLAEQLKERKPQFLMEEINQVIRKIAAAELFN
ncbi:MAG: hypothetical protein V1777_01250 [Candidatus Micrarchaeota archaeon]